MVSKGSKIGVGITGSSMSFSFLLIWQENSLGVAIDQIRGDDSIPITGYYYWPRSDAWSQILIELKTKKWISHQERVFLMGKTAEILNVFVERQLRTSEKQKDSAKAIDELAANCQIRMVGM